VPQAISAWPETLSICHAQAERGAFEFPAGADHVEGIAGLLIVIHEAETRVETRREIEPKDLEYH
jgi:hypothetical protein